MTLTTSLRTPLALLLSGSLAGALAAATFVQDDEVWTQEELEQVTREIQEEVEALRGEEFSRPVKVQITDQEGFVKYVTARMDKVTTPEKLAAEETLMKMLGLVDPGADLMEITMDLLEGQVGGFYDPGSDAFYLMESFTGGVAEIILAHELTHALDDQLYGIDTKLEELLDDRDRTLSYMSVVEGSGTVVMAQWTMKHAADLDPEDLAKAVSMGDDSLAAAPAVVWKPLLASYTLGQTFLQKGYRRLKRDGKTMGDVTRMAYENPPRSMEQVLHPDKYWVEKKRDEPRSPGEPEPAPEGWELLERSSLGELYLALITEEPQEIDFSNQMALMFLAYTNDAARGWGGDRVELYGKEGAHLLRLDTVWDSAEDAVEFSQALQSRLEAWRAALAEMDAEGVGSGVEVTVDGDRVRVRCWHSTERPAVGG